MRPPVKVTERLRFGVEDRFFVLPLADTSAMLPSETAAETIGEVFGSFPSYTLVCYIHSKALLTSDIIDFLIGLERINPVILAHESHSADLMFALSCFGAFNLAKRILPLRAAPQGLRLHNFPIPPCQSVHSKVIIPAAWSNEIDEFEDPSPLNEEEYRLILGNLDEIFAFPLAKKWPTFADVATALTSKDPLVRQDALQEFGDISIVYEEFLYARRWLQAKIPLIARNSLLVHYAFSLAGNYMTVTPYHGQAIHSVEAKSELLLGRPSIIAKQTESLLSSELAELSHLLNSHPKEADIQRFLERNHTVFQSLGYVSIYPQVILEREDGSVLRPDFILQPIGDEWCDILDLKIPDKPIVVGRKDRKTFAAAIHELAAQLREYAAYFENPVHARRVEARYGFKCYRPKLIGVIGREPTDVEPMQLRRTMTSYADLSIVTFDRLVAIARKRLLI